MRQSLWKSVSLTTGALAALIAIALPASAQTTFATFSNASTDNFSYDNLANTFGTTTPSIPVFFTFDVANTYAPAFTPIAATLTFSSFGDPIVDGSNHLGLSGVTMHITANVPGPGGANLLSLTTSTGHINGSIGGNSVLVSGDTAAGDVVNFTSDYLDFTNTLPDVWALTTSDAAPNYSIDPQNHRPGSYQATYVGTFSSGQAPAPSIPEAGTVSPGEKSASAPRR